MCCMTELQTERSSEWFVSFLPKSAVSLVWLTELNWRFAIYRNLQAECISIRSKRPEGFVQG